MNNTNNTNDINNKNDFNNRQTSKKIDYHEQLSIDNTLKLREILKTMPDFSKDYFRAMETTTTAKTRISYIYDIRLFFYFLINSNPMY